MGTSIRLATIFLFLYSGIMSCKQPTGSELASTEAEQTPAPSSDQQWATSCRSHLQGVIDGETVIGEGRTNLFVGFSGTSTSSEGMTNYLFGREADSLARSGTYSVQPEIRNSMAPASHSFAQTLAAEHDATFVFPNKSQQQGAQWPRADSGTSYFHNAVSYVDCLSQSFSHVYTIGYSNGGQSAGTVALKAQKARGSLFTAGQSQYDAHSHVGIDRSQLENILGQQSAVFFYFIGDETINAGLSDFERNYKSLLKRTKMMAIEPGQTAPTIIWPVHLTPVGSQNDGNLLRQALNFLLAKDLTNSAPSWEGAEETAHEEAKPDAPGPANECRCTRSSTWPFTVACEPGYSENACGSFIPFTR